MSPPPSYAPLPASWDTAGFGGYIQILYNHSNSEWLEDNFLHEKKKKTEKGLLLMTKFKKKTWVWFSTTYKPSNSFGTNNSGSHLQMIH